MQGISFSTAGPDRARAPAGAVGLAGARMAPAGA